MHSDCDSNQLLVRTLSIATQSVGGKNAGNLKGVERAKESMMKDLKYYATKEYLQPG